MAFSTTRPHYIGLNSCRYHISIVRMEAETFHSIIRPVRSRLLGVVAAPVIELRGAGIAVSRRLLHVFELGAVFQRRGDKPRPHRVRRIPPVQSDHASVFPDNAVNGRVHVAREFLAFAIPRKDGTSARQMSSP